LAPEREGPDLDTVRETLRDEREEVEEANGPEAAELDQDPAYNPGDENLKDLKGG